MPTFPQDYIAAPENAMSNDDVLLGHEQAANKTRAFALGSLFNVFKLWLALGTAAFKNTGTGPNDVAVGNHGHTANAISGLATVATSGAYSDLSGKPTLGDAASRNVGTGAGDLAAGAHGHLASDISDFQQAARKALEYITGAPVADVAALRLIAPGDRADKQVRFCEGNNFLYRFDAEGTGTDDGDGTIAPTTGTGRWFKIGGGGSGDVATFNGQGPSYYLNRSSHTGTQSATTITGLGTVATSNSYTDLINRPTLGTVATSNSYTDLINRPTLGGAAALNIGTGAGTVAAGNDSRLSDARTPTSHKSTHATGGADALSPSDIGAASATALADEITRAQGAEQTNATAITNLSNAPLKSSKTTLSADRTLLEGDLRGDMAFDVGNSSYTVTFPILAYPYVVLVTHDTAGSGTLIIKKTGGTTTTLTTKGETIRYRVAA